MSSINLWIAGFTNAFAGDDLPLAGDEAALAFVAMKCPLRHAWCNMPFTGRALMVQFRKVVWA